MKISTKGRYALRLMIDLAQYNTGEYITLKDISRRQDISIKYLEQIVSLLSKAGLLSSVRGPQGGYKLRKTAQEYTVGDILRVTEGSLAPVACLDTAEADCNRLVACVTREFWQGLEQVVNNYVDSITLADLAQRSKEKAGYDFNI